jgi:hypothetical protein
MRHRSLGSDLSALLKCRGVFCLFPSRRAIATPGLLPRVSQLDLCFSRGNQSMGRLSRLRVVNLLKCQSLSMTSPPKHGHHVEKPMGLLPKPSPRATPTNG